MTERLFSYGTLQLAEVQRALFGRLLDGTPDTLNGFALTTIAARDPAAIATSGVETHLALVPDAAAPPIDGILYTRTDAEIAGADDYEGADYRRIAVTFASGAKGWVYVRA